MTDTSRQKKLPTKSQLTPPTGVKSACKTGIQMVEDGFGGSGLEPATVREARAIVRGTPITIAKAKKMVRWWGRNARFLDFDKDSPAWVAALLWGGRAGLSWSRRLKRTFDAKEESSDEPTIQKGPACRQADETYDECVSRKISELMGVENYPQDRAVAAAQNMCGEKCSEKKQASQSITTSTERLDMPDIDDAILVESQEDFDSISAKEMPVEIHYKINTPFFYDEKASEGMKDTKIRGPVYVGNDDYLDRHDELVTVDAIMRAWEGYAQNPVILYNHSKTYGVIGRMVALNKGKFNGMEVPIGTAVIDGGEKDITRKIRKGMLKAFSIGFIAKAGVKECKDDDTCYMKFTEIDWVETSVVDVPASPDALFSVQKSVVPTHAGNSTGCGCGCSGEQKNSSGTTEKHVVRIEEDENYITIVYGKSDEWEGIDVDTTGSPMEVDYYDPEDDETKTVKNPDAAGLDSMTDEELDTITMDTDAEETLSAISEEVEETPVVADTIETKDADEEVVEKEVEVEAEPEMPSPREALVDIAKALGLIIEKLDAQEVVEETPEVSELETLKAEIAELRAVEEARVKEAEMEAEVERRVAERLVADATPKDAPVPARKSISQSTPEETPTVKENGLANWLAHNLATRGN